MRRGSYRAACSPGQPLDDDVRRYRHPVDTQSSTTASPIREGPPQVRNTREFVGCARPCFLLLRSWLTFHERTGGTLHRANGFEAERQGPHRTSSLTSPKFDVAVRGATQSRPPLDAVRGRKSAIASRCGT